MFLDGGKGAESSGWSDDAQYNTLRFQSLTLALKSAALTRQATHGAWCWQEHVEMRKDACFC